MGYNSVTDVFAWEMESAYPYIGGDPEFAQEDHDGGRKENEGDDASGRWPLTCVSIGPLVAIADT